METVREVLRTKHLDEYTGKSLKRRGVPEFDFSNIVRENKKSLKNQHPTMRQAEGMKAIRAGGGKGQLYKNIRQRLKDLLS